MANEISATPAMFKVYPMILQVALSSENKVDAARAVFAWRIGLACSSYYAALAAQLKATLTADFVHLCVNEYSSECEAALDRFKICSGFELSNGSPYTCPVEEWKILETAQLSLAAFTVCEADISSTAACIAADIAMEKFAACSGHEFSCFAIIPIDGGSTTSAPSTMVEPTTVDPKSLFGSTLYLNITSTLLRTAVTER